MSNFSVRLEGLDDLQRKLGADFRPMMRAATLAIAAEIQGKIAPYPPSTEANQPGSGRWYERGYGPRWTRKDGSTGGRKTSETLGRRWALGNYGDIGAKLGNAASYAPFVHAESDQALFHARRGWLTDRQATDRVRESGVMADIMRDAVMHALTKG